MRAAVVIRTREHGPDSASTEAALRYQLRVPDTVTVVAADAPLPDYAADLIAFLDAGSIPDPLWLDSLIRAFDQPFVGAAGGPIFGPDDSIEFPGGVRYRDGRIDKQVGPPWTAYQFAGSDPHAVVLPANCCIRRELLSRWTKGPTPESCAELIDAGYWVRFRSDAVVRRISETTMLPAPEAEPSDRTRLAILTPSGNDSGSGFLAAGLAERGHEVHLFHAGAQRGVGFDGQVWRHAIDSHESGLDYARASYREIRRFHDEQPFDAVVVNSVAGEGFSCVDSGAFPTVLILNDGSRSRSALELQAFRRAGCIVASTRSMLRGYGPPAEESLTFVVPPSVADTTSAGIDNVIVFRDEADPVAFATARCHGRPVVATALGGNRDLVADGEDGFLVYPHEESIRRAVDRLREDRSLWHQMADASRRRYDRWHRPSQHSKRIEEVIRTAISRRPAA